VTVVLRYLGGILIKLLLTGKSRLIFVFHLDIYTSGHTRYSEYMDISGKTYPHKDYQYM